MRPSSAGDVAAAAAAGASSGGGKAVRDPLQAGLVLGRGAADVAPVPQHQHLGHLTHIRSSTAAGQAAREAQPTAGLALGTERGAHSTCMLKTTGPVVHHWRRDPVRIGAHAAGAPAPTARRALMALTTVARMHACTCHRPHCVRPSTHAFGTTGCGWRPPYHKIIHHTLLETSNASVKVGLKLKEVISDDAMDSTMCPMSLSPLRRRSLYTSAAAAPVWRCGAQQGAHNCHSLSSVCVHATSFLPFMHLIASICTACDDDALGPYCFGMACWRLVKFHAHT